MCSADETIPMKVCEPYRRRMSTPTEGSEKVDEQSTTAVEDTTVQYEESNSTIDIADTYETIS